MSDSDHISRVPARTPDPGPRNILSPDGKTVISRPHLVAMDMVNHLGWKYTHRPATE